MQLTTLPTFPPLLIPHNAIRGITMQAATYPDNPHIPLRMDSRCGQQNCAVIRLTRARVNVPKCARVRTGAAVCGRVWLPHGCSRALCARVPPSALPNTLT
eukprot:8775489-Pyramimonas_sp.AAC.1